MSLARPRLAESRRLGLAWPTMGRPKIILSNDDGIDAPGLDALLQVTSDLGDCLVVAPASPQSGVGHAVSDDSTIPIEQRQSDRLAVGGTPADCARLALCSAASLPETWQAARSSHALWLVAGINHGANLGVDTYVSGTAAAAREAAILGFPALAISQYVGRHRTPDWGCTVLRAAPVLRELLAQRPAPGAFWNVNLPHPHDEATRCEIVHCPPDPSPHAVRYERRGRHFEYSGDFHARPRRPGHDIDVCFGGRISVSEIKLVPS